MLHLLVAGLFAAQTASSPPSIAGIDSVSPAPSDLVHAELVSDAAAIAPGSTFRLGVRLIIKEGWHVNWINPGDAGLAPSIGWKLPDGFKAGILSWPLPERFVTGPIGTFGYAGEVLLVSDVHVPGDIPTGGNVDLAADVSWLSCAEECIPGSATVQLTLPVEKTTQPNAATRSLFDQTEARWPRHSRAWMVDAWIEETNTLVLEIQSGDPGSTPLDGLLYFPYDPGLIENAAPQTVTAQPGPAGTVYQLRIERARMPAGDLTRVYGLLVASSGLSRTGGPAAIEVNVPVERR